MATSFLFYRKDCIVVETKYQNWLNHKDMPKQLRNELSQMSDKQKEDAFYQYVEFGTAGMRGHLGAGTNRLNIFTLRRVNKGYAKYIISFGLAAMEKGIAISYDNRYMSKEFAMDTARLLAKYNIKSYVFSELRPTPELSFAVRHFGCFGGVMITASHNPKEDNGYKLYDETGCQLVPELIANIVNFVKEVDNELDIKVDPTIEQEKLINIIGNDFDEVYLAKIMDIQLNTNLDKSRLKIVFTPQHGTAYEPIKQLFKNIGYNVVYVKEQCIMDPSFSNTLSPNPEEPNAYVLALEYARNNNADMVLTTDPDGDRLGVGVLHNNEYVLLNGNQSAEILLEYIFSQLTIHGNMPKNPIMVNTIVTSSLGAKIAKYYGVDNEQTLTGFKYIGNKIANYEKNGERTFVFGYEESYGCLISDFVRDKDALQACIMLAEATNFYKQQNKTLVDVLRQIYQRHGYYLDKQDSVTFKGVEGNKKMHAMLEKLRMNIPTEIGDAKVLRYEDYSELMAIENDKKNPLTGFEKADVLKYILDDGSWIAIRPSGTEPKCKFYYNVEASTKAAADTKLETYYEFVSKLIK